MQKINKPYLNLPPAKTRPKKTKKVKQAKTGSSRRNKVMKPKTNNNDLQFAKTTIKSSRRCIIEDS